MLSRFPEHLQAQGLVYDIRKWAMTVNNFCQESNSVPRIRLRFVFPYLLIFILTPLGTFIVGRWLDQVLQLPRFPPFPFNLIFGFSFLLAGGFIGIKSTRHLRKYGKGLPWGDLEVESKSTQLVTTGPYAYTRNPMVLGYSLLPFGMGLTFQSLGMAVFIPLLVLCIMVSILKLWEEPDLERKFGNAYREYKRNTPFLIPRFGSVLRSLFVMKQKPSKRRVEPE